MGSDLRYVPGAAARCPSRRAGCARRGGACVPLVLAMAGPALEGRRPRPVVLAAAVVVTCGAALVQGVGRTDGVGLAWAAVVLACEAGFTLLAVPVLVRHGPWGSRCTPHGSRRRPSRCSAWSSPARPRWRACADRTCSPWGTSPSRSPRWPSSCGTPASRASDLAAQDCSPASRQWRPRRPGPPSALRPFARWCGSASLSSRPGSLSACPPAGARAAATRAPAVTPTHLLADGLTNRYAAEALLRRCHTEGFLPQVVHPLVHLCNAVSIARPSQWPPSPSQGHPSSPRRCTRRRWVTSRRSSRPPGCLMTDLFAGRRSSCGTRHDACP